MVTAPDAHIETARTSAGGNVTVVTSAALREAVVSTSGMAVAAVRPGLPGVGDEPVRRALGGPDATAVPLLASAVRPGDRIGITVEPAGGTAQPTTTPVACP